MEDPDNEPLHSPRVSSPEGAYAVGVPRSLDDGSSVPKLKAQLKLVTQERDLLKDAASKKRYSASMDRDNLLSLQGQVPVGPGNKHLLYPNPPMEIIHHQRTNSDSAQSPSKAMNPNLSRSHSIAAAGDKSLLFSIAREPNETSPPGPKMPSVDRSHHEFLPGNPRKQPNDALKKLEQALKDIEFYRRESESYRSRYNDLLVENQRGDQEINSLRIYLEDERKEMLDLRQQLQNILNSEGGPGDSLSIMYGALLQNYEAVKDDYNLLRRRYDDLAASHQSAVAKLEHSQNFQDDGVRYKKLYQDLVTERNQLKHQCTQAIRQWDQALRERNEYKDSLVKVQRQHEEAVKEVNQAMTVRIKASKDLKRLTEERNAAMQEYSLIMSERDTVHKEIEKLQEEVSATKKKMSGMESKSKVQDDERRKLTCQVEILKREIEQALYDRDKAVKEAHEWRDKLGGGKMASDYGEHGKHSSKSKFDVEKNKRDRDGASTETLDTSASQSLSDLGTKQRMENLDQANAEIDRLRKMTEKLGGDLQDAGLEADVAKGRRDWAFSERDKVVLERESIRTLCDKLRRERDRAVSELAEALRDSDDVKKQQNEAIKENKELRERLESLEKEVRLKSLHCSPGHSHSHDSAIDSDLQEWETENIDIDMNGLGSTEDLGLDLAGGRDDLHCPSGDKPIYISSIGKGSFLDGKLKVNDCILRVNDLNCRLVERSTILNTLRNANSAVSLVVRRRKTGRRYQAVLSMAGASSPGITLDLGVYVARISPGSVAAKEGSIAVGDRILSINDRSVDHVDHIGEAVKLLNSGQDPLVITLAKSIHSQSSLGGGHLSSSSSGHNMQERFDDEQMTHAHQPHPQHSHKLPGKSGSGTISSPIKDTIRGSQEFVRKLLISRDASGSSSGGSQARHSNSALSSSSEKVYNVTKGQMGISGKESRGSMGLMETVKEKVRGRRRSSKEHSEMSSHENVSSSRDNSLSHQPEQPPKGSADVVLAELDSVLDAFHGNKNQNAAEPNAPNLNNSSGASSNKSSGKKKRNKDRDSFRSGGTWPRTRGGPVIEHGTGTILHPQKVKKERLPLAELLNNLPKYPPEATSPKKTEAEPLVAYRQDTYSHSTREPRRNRPLTTYDLLENYGRYKKSSEERFLPPPPESEMFALEARKSVYGSAFTPSDHSIDESVKSGHAEKEVLERYLKKSSSTKLHQPLSLSGTIGESEQSNNPEVATTPIDNLSSPILSSPPPPMSLTGTNTAYAALKAMHDIKPPDSAHLMRSTASGFSPYFPSSIGHHSSPRYASPPPLVSVASGDSLLGSPIPDVRQTPGSEGGLLTQSGYNQVYESPSAMNLPMGTYANTSPSAGYGYAPASDYPGAHQIPPNSKYRYSMGMSGGHVVSPSNMGSLYHHATQPPYPGSHHYSQGSSNTQGVYGHYGHRRQTDEGVSPPLYLDHHHNPERQYVSRRRENVGYPSRVSPKQGGTLPSAGKLRSAELSVNRLKSHTKNHNSGSSGTEKDRSSSSKKSSRQKTRSSRENMLRARPGSSDSSDAETKRGMGRRGRSHHENGSSSLRRQTQREILSKSVQGTCNKKGTLVNDQRHPLWVHSTPPRLVTSSTANGSNHGRSKVDPSKTVQTPSYHSHRHGNPPTSRMTGPINNALSSSASPQKAKDDKVAQEKVPTAKRDSRPLTKLSNSADDLLSESQKGYRIPSPATVLKSLEIGEDQGYITSKDPFLMYPTSRGRSAFREELDFTSNRQRSENDKRKLIEELKEQQPLIQDRLARGLSFPDPPQEARILSPRCKEISRSYGDSLDEAQFVSRQSSSRTTRSRSKENLANKKPKASSSQENDYDEVSLSASAKASSTPAPPSIFSDSSKGAGEGLSELRKSLSSVITEESSGMLEMEEGKTGGQPGMPPAIPVPPLSPFSRHKNKPLPNIPQFAFVQPHTAHHQPQLHDSHYSNYPPTEQIYEKAYFKPVPRTTPGAGTRSAPNSNSRTKRLRNRSLEMVLDDPKSGATSSPVKTRIPSNNSIGSQGSYTQIPSLSSIDGRSSSKCNSPLPIYSVQYIIRDGRPVTADTLNSRHHIRKPLPGDIRDIDIEKTSEQLGITIADGSNKGVFVSSVSENSLASQVGLQVGDQLLDVCGINLRNCNKERAALVLQQVRNSITMKVQYNPHDYRNAQEEIHLDNNNDEDDDDDSDLDVPLTQERHSSVRQRHGPQSSPPRSGSPTPRNSPKSHRGPSMHREDYGTVCGALTHSSTHSTLTRHQINQIVPNLQANLIPPRAPASPPYEPRWVSPVMKKSGDLGVRLVGGNAVGIFIHSVERDSAAHLVGLRSAEQILEYNGVNLRQATAEQAAYELAKPAEKVSLFVQYNPDKYNLVKDQPGDSYYVRAMFDRIVDINTDPSQLAFRKDDILFIDNTMYNGVPGNWSAWIVDVDGKRTQWGIIPSKYKNIERALMTNNVIEYKRRGTQYECITVEAIKDVCERNQHCILNVHLEVVERLHQNHIYPIVLLIKFKSVKQIKEVKVPTMSADRISQKDAKNIFEHTQKLEGDYKHLISDIIHAGANLMLMCAQINSKIDQEQNKTLWVPCGTIW
eukprot:TCALIF_04803-PB protein Name:"Similar to DLG5 Disks large homolog 5 (Homo sapiens)" AED:0.05 eAED:0.05 QI:159/0.84/0.87/0.96/0.93/0.93/33/0/2582